MIRKGSRTGEERVARIICRAAGGVNALYCRAGLPVRLGRRRLGGGAERGPGRAAAKRGEPVSPVRTARSSTRMPVGRSRVHGEVQGDRRNAWAGVYDLVRRIPKGRVMTYGQIATLLGSRLSPRAVGWAMHGSPRGVPWHRVVNASGGCSTDRMPDIAPGLQRALLEAEGVSFRPDGTLDLARHRWTPPAGKRRPKNLLRKRR